MRQRQAGGTFGIGAALGLLFLAGCGRPILISAEEDEPLSEPTPTVEPVLSEPALPGILKLCRAAPYPIVLAHGFTGFRDLGPLNYFNRVADALRALGHVVHEAEVAPYQSSVVRGAQLASFIDAVLEVEGSCKVNLVGHSQGGIDARYAVSALGYGDKVSSLVTVSTPHRGTRLSDAALGRIPGFTAPMLDFFALLIGRAISEVGDDPDLQAFFETISEESMNGFNSDHPDDPQVAYFSAAGRTGLVRAEGECADAVWPNPLEVDATHPLFWATEPFLAGNPFDRRANDGLVTVESARWGTFLGCVPGDHLDEIGQIAQPAPLVGWDHVDLYRDIVAHLRQQGH